jgi:hypothetical protein
MNVAWVTHHLLKDDDTENPDYLLPGKYAGGAEMTDAELIAAKPDGINITVHSPDEWESALESDHIVVTGTDMLTNEAMLGLATKKPTVFLHHLQVPGDTRKQLINSARVLILHTPAHEQRERKWTEPKRVVHVLSPLDVSECHVGQKQNKAIWSQRMHDLKGPRTALMWAARNNIPLVRMSHSPRSEVLAEMAVSKYYVHLPIGFESESRATIEAVLSGCECIVNENVGLTSVPRWNDREHLAELVSTAAATWWKAALS